MHARLACIDAAVVIDEIQLSRFPVTIGRSAEAGICIDNSWISRFHCIIDENDGVLVVRDLRSRNGTFVNGEPISESALYPGDKLTLGMSTFLVSYKAELHEMPSTIVYEPGNG